MMKAGLQSLPKTFLFVDTQVQDYWHGGFHLKRSQKHISKLNKFPYRVLRNLTKPDTTCISLVAHIHHLIKQPQGNQRWSIYCQRVCRAVCEWVVSSLAQGNFFQFHPKVWWVHRFQLSETKHYWPLVLEVLSKMILSLFKKRVDLRPYTSRIMLAVNCNLLMSRPISTSGITVMFPIGFFTAFIIIGTIPLWQSPKQ